MHAHLLLLIVFSLLLADAASAGRPAVRPSAFDTRFSDGSAAFLCDPNNFRMSIRFKADRTTLDRSYPIRRLIRIDGLVPLFPNHYGEMAFRGRLVRYEQCGPYRVEFQGDALNSSVQGELGAYEPFLSVRILADNLTLFPADARTRIRLFKCETDTSRRWGDCPSDYATRLDAAYEPEGDKVTFQEWAISYDIDGKETSHHRQSTNAARLSAWWLVRRTPRK